MLKNLQFLFALSLGIFLFACHKNADTNANRGKPNGPCKEDGTCDKGYSCVDNSCKCPGKGIVYNGACLQFEGSDPTYVAFTSECFCYDTLALTITGTGEHRIGIMPIKLGDLVGSTTMQVEYYESENGDSLHIWQMPSKCTFGTKTGYPEAYGKIQADKSLKLKLIFKDPLTADVTGECAMIMKKL